MQNSLYHEDIYFMDDPREGERLEKKANAQQFLDKYLQPHVDHLSNGIILEAGCGSGSLSVLLAKEYPCLSIMGIDVSEHRVKQANLKMAGLKNFKAVRANIYHLPFPDNYFDFVYSRFLFEYLKEPIPAAKELYRVCKPGAKLLLQDLDGQFTIYPEVLPGLSDVLTILKDQAGFDPNVGRKLFSFGKAAGFSFLNAESELYHKVFGKIDDFNYELWDLKLDIAGKYLKGVVGDEKAEKLKAGILEILKDENIILFSNLFTVTFIKSMNT